VKRKNYPIKLLVGADGTPLTAVNVITRLLNRVFGKKIGSSMLRHIYLSDKYKDTIDEMKTDAAAMGHSVGQQRAYVKKDAVEEAAPKNEIVS
jgi:integrase